MTDIEKLRRFVETIAKQTMCEEEQGWEPEQTGISDDNQDITLAQAIWADEIVMEARKLTGLAPASTPDSQWARGARDSLNDYLCVENPESNTVMGLVLDTLAKYPDAQPEFRESISRLREQFVPSPAKSGLYSYAVYYKSPQEMVYTVTKCYGPEEAKAKFREGHDEEIIRVEKV